MLVLRSDAFSHGAAIPRRYTCDGENVSPPLEWSGLPKGAKSVALVMEDPDAPGPAAPKMTFVHWLLYNLPSEVSALPEAAADDTLPAGVRSGINDWRRTGYGGPCPPSGTHHYVIRLYALDSALPDLKHPTIEVLEQAMEEHVLGHTELMGTYKKEHG